MVEIIKIVPKYRVDEINKKNKKTKWNTELFKKELNLINSNVDVVSDYINAKTKIELICKIHNERFYQYPDNALKGYSGCKYCKSKNHSNSSVKDTQFYIQKLLNLNSTVKPKEKYIGMKTSILHECILCEYKWKIIPESLLRNNAKCPNCTNLDKKQKFLKIIKKNYVNLIEI